MAKLQDGLASITFGAYSRVSNWLPRMRVTHPKGFGDAAVAMRAKFQESMQGVADGDATGRAMDFQVLPSNQTSWGCCRRHCTRCKNTADSINTMRESAIKEGDAWLEAAGTKSM